VRNLLERWRYYVAAVRVLATTFERYREHVTRLMEGLGSVPLLQLQPLTVEAFFGTLPDAGGGPVSPRALSKAFAELARRAGVASVTLHGLRHTHVELLRAGVDLKLVSERAGHSSVAVTLQRYGHALPDMQQNAADETERLVGSLAGR
jgi:integrase